MYSMTRLVVGVVVYIAYLLAIMLTLQYSVLLYLVLLFAGVAVLLVAFYSGWLTRPGNYNRLMKNGLEASAEILEMKDTGVTINNNPYVRLKLRVHPDGQPAYETSIGELVSRIAFPSVGDTLKVRYDPAKPQDVIVE